MSIILNILTHGDERIGLAVAKELQKLSLPNGALVVQIANEKAYKLGKRFVDQDLNRSFPGKKYGNYETRRAYELSPIVKAANIVIDIHSTTSELKDAIIVTKLDRATRGCIEAIRPKYALVMRATKKSALISQAKIGIAFEYGKDNDPKAIRKTAADIKRLLQYRGVITGVPKKRTRITKFFDVIAEVPKPKGYVLLKRVRNYALIKKGTTFAARGSDKLIAQKDFYPILFGQNNYETIFGFKAKTID